MTSTIVFAIPFVSLIYLLQTIFLKSLRGIVRIPLIGFAFIVFLFDILIALYFFTACFEMIFVYGYSNCLSWIYPTLDFQIMVLLSLTILTLSVWALIRKWKKSMFYLLGSVVLYLGVVFRLLIFLQFIKVMTISGSISTPILFEFFSIMVVYGLISAAIYSGIFLMGFEYKKNNS